MIGWIIWSFLGVSLALLGIKCYRLSQELRQTEFELSCVDKTLTQIKNSLRGERLRSQRLLGQVNSRLHSEAFSLSIPQIYPFRVQLWEISPDGLTKGSYFGTLSQAQTQAKALRTTGVSTIILHSKFLTSSMDEELSSLSSGQYRESMPDVLNRLEAELSNVLIPLHAEASIQEIPSEVVAYSPPSIRNSQRLEETQSIGS